MGRSLGGFYHNAIGLFANALQKVNCLDKAIMPVKKWPES
jgi:hypothetical protein